MIDTRSRIHVIVSYIDAIEGEGGTIYHWIYLDKEKAEKKFKEVSKNKERYDKEYYLEEIITDD